MIIPVKGTVLNKEIPHGVNRSDLQAHRLALANINFYFMLKYRQVDSTLLAIEF